MLKLFKNAGASARRQRAAVLLAKTRTLHFSKAAVIESEELFEEPVAEEELAEPKRKGADMRAKGYARIFTDEIQYTLNTKALADITLYMKDALNIRLEYFTPSSIINLAWLYRNNTPIVDKALQHLSGPANAKLGRILEAKDVALFLFQNTHNDNFLSMLWAFKKFKPLILQAEGLTLRDRLCFGCILPRMGVFHKPYLDDVIEEIVAKTQEGKIAELLADDADLCGFLLAFLNNSVSLFCRKDVVERVISPALIRQLNDFFANKADVRYHAKFAYFVEKIIGAPTNTVLRQLITNLIRKL